MKKGMVLFCIFILLKFFILPVQYLEVNSGKKLLIVPESATNKEIKKVDIIFGHVKKDVVVNNTVIIKQDAPVKLYVNDAKRAHRWGVAGYITLSRGSVEDVIGEERDILLDYEIKGDEKDWVKATASLCIATIILSPFGFLALIKGGEAELQPINVIEAELIDDFSI